MEKRETDKKNLLYNQTQMTQISTWAREIERTIRKWRDIGDRRSKTDRYEKKHSLTQTQRKKEEEDANTKSNWRNKQEKIRRKTWNWTDRWTKKRDRQIRKRWERGEEGERRKVGEKKVRNRDKRTGYNVTEYMREHEEETLNKNTWDGKGEFNKKKRRYKNEK